MRADRSVSQEALRSGSGRRCTSTVDVDTTRRSSCNWCNSKPVTAAYVAAGIDVIALHVYDPKTVPRFHDGPEDDAVWRDEFLAQHCADLGLGPVAVVPTLVTASGEGLEAAAREARYAALAETAAAMGE